MSLQLLSPPDANRAEPASTRPPSEWGPAALAIAVFAVLSLGAALTSPGFLEADSCTHYLYARRALTAPAYFVNVWGRPLCTGLYAIPAALGGRIGARAASLAVAVAIALVARELAKGQRWRWPVLALICTLAQPLLFLHSFTTLTELPFALVLALAFWAYQRRQFFWMALAAGITPLGRPEGFGLLLLAAVGLAAHRRLRWLWVLPLPLVLWDVAGWLLSGQPGGWHGCVSWLLDNWPWAQSSLYDRGSLLHFVGLLPVVTSPLFFPAMVIGVWLCLRRPRRSWHGYLSQAAPAPADNPHAQDAHATDSQHLLRCQWLIAILPLGVLAVHSLLYWRGKMASNGEARYMLVAAPFWGLLAARGWGWVFDRLHWQHPLRWAGLAALLPIVANRAYGVVPLRLQPDWMEAQQIANWYRSDHWQQRYPNLLVPHPGVIYFLDRPNSPLSVAQWTLRSIRSRPPHTLVIWDPVYGVYNSDRARSISVDQLRSAGWTPLPTTWDGPGTAGGWRAFVSDAGAAVTPSPR